MLTPHSFPCPARTNGFSGRHSLRYFFPPDLEYFRLLCPFWLYFSAPLLPGINHSFRRIMVFGLFLSKLVSVSFFFRKCASFVFFFFFVENLFTQWPFPAHQSLVLISFFFLFLVSVFCLTWGPEAFAGQIIRHCFRAVCLQTFSQFGSMAHLFRAPEFVPLSPRNPRPRLECSPRDTPFFPSVFKGRCHLAPSKIDTLSLMFRLVQAFPSQIPSPFFFSVWMELPFS